MLDGSDLRDVLQAVLPAEVIEERARALGVVQRERKQDVAALVRALVLSAGSDDSGRLADAMRRYHAEASSTVVRGTFYAWLDDELAELMHSLLDSAVEHARAQPVYLPGVLAGVSDWRVVDSETATLRDVLSEHLPASGSAAGVKAHKELSLGSGCMVGYHLSCARDHDSPHLVVDERYRGMGVIADLGYASFDRLRACEQFDVKYVIRLKESWQPRVAQLVAGEVTGELMAGCNLDVALVNETLRVRGEDIDADVVLGRGRGRVQARLVAVALPANSDGEVPYQYYLTNLSRETHGPRSVSDLYRLRWEIEISNKLDKTGSRLDQIRATNISSVRILLFAALLHSLIADLLVHRDVLARVRRQALVGAPLHRLLMSHALRDVHCELLMALSDPKTPESTWHKIARRIDQQGRDPNWRRRPSILDSVRGFTAPPGRARRARSADSHPSAAARRMVA